MNNFHHLQAKTKQNGSRLRGQTECLPTGFWEQGCGKNLEMVHALSEGV